MRVSRAEMDLSHKRIVEGSARLLRERGVENTTVAEIMEAAGLTHGGFYRHFDTKEALVSAAIKAAFVQLKGVVERNTRDKDQKQALAKYHAYYLSETHIGNPSTACPVAMLAGDVARASAALKQDFGQGVMQMIEMLAGLQPGTKKERQTAAIHEFALLVGAAVIARASDPDTAKTILAACRSHNK